MHDMLISLCTQEQRLEEAVDLVKRLARRPPSAAGAATASAGSASGAASPRSSSPPAGGASSGGGGSGGGATTSGGLQEQTLNSLIRALCGKYIDRALRLQSLCQTMGLRTSRATYLALVAGCARGSRSAAAYELYRTRECAAAGAACAGMPIACAAWCLIPCCAPCMPALLRAARLSERLLPLPRAPTLLAQCGPRAWMPTAPPPRPSSPRCARPTR